MKRLFQILALLILVLATFACAKIGSPLGGAKDETPPVIIKARPPENSVNFIPQKKIVLVFDEYIQLKDIFQELIISPPIEGKISAQMKGKSLVVEFPKEAVFDSTTYTISFGNAIADNNEGNILENYQYIFSLKDYIDTMNVEGTIINAFNHQPDEERMLVMLYKNLNDSAPLNEIPSYICRSDNKGYFSINNIETGFYRIFGLKDANLNMMYDLPNENIAFADSLIEITAEKFWENVVIEDSILYDSLLNTLKSDTLRSGFNAADSILVDSVLASLDYSSDTLVSDSTASDSIVYQNYYSFNTELFFFAQKSYNQYMTNYLRPRRQQLIFTFNETLIDSFELFPLNHTPLSKEWFILDPSDGLDTLNFWITDTSLFSMDSLNMEFCYPLLDSSGQVYFHPDTLLMLFKDEKPSEGGRSKDRSKSDKSDFATLKPSSLTIQNNIRKANAFDLNRKIALISETPLQNFIADSIQLFRVQDTLEFATSYRVYLDTGSLYRLFIDFEPEEQTNYRVFCPDSIITDIYGVTNDTLEYRFRTQSLSAYSILSLRMENVNSDIILQLLNDKEEVLQERFLNADGIERFEYLLPRKYVLKVILDNNKNRIWDTGDYLKKIQPEKVLYYDQVIDLRANWEMEYSWDLRE